MNASMKKKARSRYNIRCFKSPKRHPFNRIIPNFLSISFFFFVVYVVLLTRNSYTMRASLHTYMTLAIFAIHHTKWNAHHASTSGWTILAYLNTCYSNAMMRYILCKSNLNNCISSNNITYTAHQIIGYNTNKQIPDFCCDGKWAMGNGQYVK